MPRRPKGSVPSLVHHKPTGRARVRINGRDHWLGKWGSAEAQLSYQRLVAEFLASGRVLPEPPTAIQIEPTWPGAAVASASPVEQASPGALTVVELVAMYVEHCRTYLQGSGRQADDYLWKRPSSSEGTENFR